MTVYVNEEDLLVNLYFNIPNVSDSVLYTFDITSEYSHEPLELVNALLATNSRYTQFQVLFPTGFGDEHKNGIYYWNLKQVGVDIPLQSGLMKIITNPGGEIHTLAYDSGLVTEERVSEVYFRPNYT